MAKHMIEQAASSCACQDDEKRAQHDPAYHRALVIVVALNLGFGLCELAGGLLAHSQALKADSLDFLGDRKTGTFVSPAAETVFENVRKGWR